MKALILSVILVLACASAALGQTTQPACQSTGLSNEQIERLIWIGLVIASHLAPDNRVRRYVRRHAPPRVGTGGR